MLSITSADSLITAWAWWSNDDRDLPKPPGNHWHFMQQTGYRQSAPVPLCDPEDMLLVDRAMAQLKRSYDWEWRCIKAFYLEKRQRSEAKLTRALTAFCSVY